MSASLFDAAGPRARRRIAVVNAVGLVLVALAVGWAAIGLHAQGQLAAAKWQPFLEGSTWQHYLLPGLWATLRATALSIVLAFVFGLVFGLGRLARVALIRAPCAAVVEFFRAVPVLVMMLFFYSVFAYTDAVDSTHAAFYGVVAGLTLYNGSVIAELVRSGIQGLPKGQREAGIALGLTHQKSLRLVEVPQALIAMMPSLVSQLVVILKDTGLGYLINYAELLRQARLVGSSNANLLPALIVAAIVFAIVNNLLTHAAERSAGRLSRRTTTRPTAIGADSTFTRTTPTGTTD